MKRFTLLLPLLLVGLAACDAVHPTNIESMDEAIGLSSSNSSPTFGPVYWPGAIANCGDDIGRIQFWGNIEGVDHTVVDGRGHTHRTRVWRVKGLEAKNLDFGTEYDVVGGAEMLTWHTQLGHVPGQLRKSFHTGNLVFQPRDGGTPVIAHHKVLFVQTPDGEVRLDFHEWRCISQGTVGTTH
jgi:hypothetical protein